MPRFSPNSPTPGPNKFGSGFWVACRRSTARSTTTATHPKGARTGPAPANCTHFLLDCRAYAAFREAFLRKLSTACTCDKRPPCSEFFAGVDAEGKALFILGGPVLGRSIPGGRVDAACRAHVLEAYTIRSALLNSQAAEPLVRDLAKVGRRGREVPPFLAPSPRLSRTLLDYLRPVPPPPQASQNRSRATHARTHEHARSPRMIGNAKILGSGLNGSKAMRSA